MLTLQQRLNYHYGEVGFSTTVQHIIKTYFDITLHFRVITKGTVLFGTFDVFLCIDKPSTIR